jgi:hypothetical protein
MHGIPDFRSHVWTGLEEREPGGQPCCQTGLREAVVHVTSLATLDDDAVGPQKRQVLRNAGMEKPEPLRETRHVVLASTQFFDDSKAVRMGQSPEPRREFPRSLRSMEHAHTFLYMHIYKYIQNEPEGKCVLGILGEKQTQNLAKPLKTHLFSG